MKVFVGADHNGFSAKNELIEYLIKQDYDVVDMGDKVLDPVDDFPVYAQKVVEAILSSGDNEVRGILLCSSGQGMVMAANRYKGIRAGIVWDVEEAKAVRNDDDSNVLCLPARFLNTSRAKIITDVWLTTPFAKAARFIRRINEIDKLG
jgi:ribose 5-phosphate isomerase B